MSSFDWAEHDRRLEKADAFAHDGWPTVRPMCQRCGSYFAADGRHCGLCAGRLIAAESGGDRDAGPARLNERPRLTLVRTEL